MTNPHPTLNQSHNTGGVGASNQEVFSQRGSGLVPDQKWPAEIASTLNAAFGSKLGLEDQHINGGAPLFVPSAIPILEPGARTGKSTTDVRAGLGVGDDGDPMFTLQAGKQHGVAFAQNTRDEVRLVGGDGSLVGALAAQPGMKQTSYVAVSTGGDIAHTLNTASNGKGCSEDGTGRGVPTIAFSSKDYGADATEDMAPTLRAGGHTDSHANSGVPPAVTVALRGREDGTGRGVPTIATSVAVFDPNQITSRTNRSVPKPDLCHTLPATANSPVAFSAHTVALRGREGGATAEVGGEVATALRASSGGGDKPHVLATMEVAGTMKACAGTSGGWSNSADHAAAGYMQVDHSMAVRRLTPTECERLQGFPDGHTDVPYRKKPAADGPRYKALGNSMAVPCMRWIGSRIQRHLDGDL